MSTVRLPTKQIAQLLRLVDSKLGLESTPPRSTDLVELLRTEIETLKAMVGSMGDEIATLRKRLVASDFTTMPR